MFYSGVTPTKTGASEYRAHAASIRDLYRSYLDRDVANVATFELATVACLQAAASLGTFRPVPSVCKTSTPAVIHSQLFDSEGQGGCGACGADQWRAWGRRCGSGGGRRCGA